MAVVAVLATVTCRPLPGRDGSAVESRHWTAVLSATDLPAPRGSAHVRLTGSKRGVIASWLEQPEGTTALWFSELSGGRWTAPVAAATGRDWFVSWADVPGVMRLASGTVVAHWYTNTDARSEAYDLRLSVSTDDGATWSSPFTPHHDGTNTQHGFASLFDLDGGLGLVWLDAREWALATEDPEGGAVMLRFARFDSSWRQVADEAINLRVCECCQTAAVAVPGGVLTAFRDRTADDVRDIMVSRLEQGRSAAAMPVHRDGWQVPACPVNGPALVDDGRWTAVAWFTGVGDSGHAYAAFSPDHGRTWQKPVRLDADQSLGRVDIEIIQDRGAIATWIEFANGRSRARLRWLDAAGAVSSPVDLVDTSRRVTGQPHVARAGDTVVVAWTENGGDETSVQVKAAIARLEPVP